MNGRLFIVSAPSGAGKTSLLKALVESMEGLNVAVSHTTRQQRPGEIDGQHYHFVDAARFTAMVLAGEFLEYAEVFGNRYGTARASVEGPLSEGRDVILEIDWQGARQVREVFNICTSIFILPPSRAALDSRLRGRGQDDDSVIEKRMAAAVSEASHYREYDYLVINDDFERALTDLCAIIAAERLRIGRQAARNRAMIDELLERSEPPQAPL